LPDRYASSATSANGERHSGLPIEAVESAAGRDIDDGDTPVGVKLNRQRHRPLLSPTPAFLRIDGRRRIDHPGRKIAGIDRRSAEPLLGGAASAGGDGGPGATSTTGAVFPSLRSEPAARAIE
jgi:hypothetical protein